MTRIFCVGRNYRAHAQELGNASPTEPVIFMKPWTALQPIVDGEPLRLSAQLMDDIHYEAELVFRLGKDNTLAAMTLGLDLTRRNKQAQLKAQGLPWEAAKAFDGSAAIGPWIAVQDIAELHFKLLLDDTLVQQGRIREQIFSIDQVLTAINSWITTKPGDIIMTGTPAGVGQLLPGQTGRLVLFTSAGVADAIMLEASFRV